MKLFLGGLGCSHFHGFDPPLHLQHMLSPGLRNAHLIHDVKQDNAEELLHHHDVQCCIYLNLDTQVKTKLMFEMPSNIALSMKKNKRLENKIHINPIKANA